MGSNGRILWLAGSFAGGKSITARILGERYSLDVYHTDYDLINNPELEFARVDSHDWFWLPVSEKRERYEKVFEHVVSRAQRMSESGNVIVEGPCLMPALLHLNKIPAKDVVVLIATPTHQRAANRNRRKHWSRDILDDFEDRVEAWDEWMTVDDEFAATVSESAAEYGYSIVLNDGAQFPEKLALQIAQEFGI